MHILCKTYIQAEKTLFKSVASIISRAQRLDLEKLANGQNLVGRYKEVRDAGNKLPDKIVVSFLLGSSVKWEEITPENQKWLIYKAKGIDPIKLDELIRNSLSSA